MRGRRRVAALELMKKALPASGAAELFSWRRMVWWRGFAR